jgi:hypothetical protein
VHEHIFAAVIALDETEALHVVEEFDSAIGALAGQLALRAATITTSVTAAISTTEAATVAATKTSTIATVETATIRTRRAFRHWKRIAFDDQVGCRNLAAAIHQSEFQRLAFGKTGQASLFDSADVDENVIGLVIALDEAKAFLAVEEFDDAFAGTDNLCRHCRAARSAAKAAATAAAETTAAATAAEASAPATISATASTAATAAIISTANFAGERGGFTKTIVTKTITLVTAAATTLVIKTHV